VAIGGNLPVAYDLPRGALIGWLMAVSWNTASVSLAIHRNREAALRSPNGRGKMIGPWQGLDGKVHPATRKTFALEFCAVARWKNREIVEENLFYDQVGFLKQIGVL
jgi:hypothetical protein